MLVFLRGNEAHVVLYINWYNWGKSNSFFYCLKGFSWCGRLEDIFGWASVSVVTFWVKHLDQMPRNSWWNERLVFSVAEPQKRSLILIIGVIYAWFSDYKNKQKVCSFSRSQQIFVALGCSCTQQMTRALTCDLLRARSAMQTLWWESDSGSSASNVAWQGALKGLWCCPAPDTSRCTSPASPRPPPTPLPLSTFRPGCLHYFHRLPLLWQHPLRIEGHWDFEGAKPFYAAVEVHLILVSQCGGGVAGWGRGAAKPPIWSSFGPIYYVVKSQMSWADPSLAVCINDDAVINYWRPARVR